SCLWSNGLMCRTLLPLARRSLRGATGSSRQAGVAAIKPTSWPGWVTKHSSANTSKYLRSSSLVPVHAHVLEDPAQIAPITVWQLHRQRRAVRLGGSLCAGDAPAVRFAMAVSEGKAGGAVM